MSLVPLTAFAVYTGNDPVVRSTNTDLTFETNSGATDWVITHIAVWDTTNAAIQSVVTLPTPISVGPNEAPTRPRVGPNPLNRAHYLAEVARG